MDAARALALARRWWWLICIGALTAAAAYGVALKLRDDPPVYAARAVLVVSFRSDDRSPSGDAIFRPWDLDRLINSYAGLLQDRAVSERAAQILGADADPSRLRRSISATSLRDTQLLNLSVRAGTPRDAETLRDTVVRAFDALRDERGLPGDALLFSSEPATVVDSGTSPLFMAAIMATAGALSAAGIVLAFEYLSDAVYDATDVERATGLPVLARFGRMRDLAPAGSAAHERVRMLAAALSAAAPDARVFLYTSASPRDRVTAIACHHAALVGARLLKSEEMHDGILDGLRATGHRVLIDAPCVLTHADASVVAPEVDAAVVAVRACMTSRRDAAGAVEMLRRAGARVAGCVLTDDPSVAHRAFGAIEREAAAPARPV